MAGPGTFSNAQNETDIEGCYVPRKFKLNYVLDVKCLLNIDSSEKIALNDPRYTNKENPVEISNDKDFQRLCEKYPEKNIHWLKYDSNSNLILYKSRGKLDYLRKYLVEDRSSSYSEETLEDRSSSYSEETLIENPNKLLIISDTPGMGKSTVLSSLAQKIISQYPDYWAIKVNLNECTEALKAAKRRNISIANPKELLDFMLNYILPSSENTKLKNTSETKLFENSLTNNGRLVLLFDGFDEISPTYDSLVIKMLKELMKTRVEKIIISTGPSTKEQLENSLSTWAHTMVPFSEHDQVHFIVKYLQKQFNIANIKFPETIKDLKMYVSTSIENLSKSIKDNERQFMGIPLQCILLASYMLRKISIEQFETIGKVSSVDLYNNFIEAKLEIYDTEEVSSTDGNVAAINARKSMKTQMLRQYALQLLLSKKVYKELKYPELKDGKGLVQDSLLKAGVYIGNLTFTRRTFAEYFVVDYLLYLAKNTNENDGNWIRLSILTGEIMIKEEFKVIRTFLDGLIRNSRYSEETETILRSYVEFLSKTYPLEVCFNASGETVLYVLVREGQLDTLSNLIDILSIDDVLLKSFVDSRELLSPLYLSCQLGYNEIVEKLLKAGSDVKYDRWSPLYVACKNSLMQNGAEDEARSDIETTPKQPASSDNHVKIIKLLINAGADVNYLDSEDQESPLHIVSYHGQIDVMKLLLERGANYDLKNDIGLTPMHRAALGGHVLAVELLLKPDANCDLMSHTGQTPMHVAASKGFVDVVQLLIKRGANCNLKNDIGETPMHIAANEGRFDVVKLLIERGAHLNLKNDRGETPMHIAAYRGFVDVVKLLIERGAYYDLTTNSGETPMHMAADEGHVNVVKLLIERGANCNLQNEKGKTPMHHAAYRGRVDVVRLLLDHGANYDLKNYIGERPMHRAALGGSVDVMKLLLQHGANHDIKSDSGETPIHLAAYRGHVDVVKLLLESGADPRIKNKNGKTPLKIARRLKHDQVKELLKRY